MNESGWTLLDAEVPYEPRARDGSFRCQCGRTFTTRSGLGRHRGATDHYPRLSDTQHRIIEGLVIGDGTVFQSGSKTKLTAASTNRKFISYLDGMFPQFAPSIRRKALKGDRTPYGTRNYDLYRISFGTHPEFAQYQEWYDDGKSSVLDDFELTPLNAAIWYGCDGSFNGTAPVYWSENLVTKMGVLRAAFNRRGFYPRFSTDKRGAMEIAFHAHDAAEFFEWLGDPLPGFEYKWGL